MKIALSDYLSVLKLNPNDEETKQCISLIYANNGREEYAKGLLDQAISSLTTAISFNRLNSDYYFERGRAYLALENVDMARLDFKTGYDINPNNVKINGK